MKDSARGILGKLMPANSCDFKGTPPHGASAYRLFSPLFCLFRGTHNIYGKKFTLFPKAVCMRQIEGAWQKMSFLPAHLIIKIIPRASKTTLLR